MAFRSSASATGTGTGTITATPAGVAAHDYLGGWWLADGSATPTLTPPSGWTQRASVHTTLDGQTQFYADKDDATGSDAFGFADDAAGNNKALITAAWSGRNNSAPRSATPVTTGNSASNTSPISATITGITAVSGDDIGIGLGTDEDTAGARWTESTIASYTQQVNGVAIDWVSGAGLQTRDNVSAGATGNFAVTITRTAGLGNSGYCGIVVAIAAAASGTTTSAINRPTRTTSKFRGGPAQRFAFRHPVTPIPVTEIPTAAISSAGAATATFTTQSSAAVPFSSAGVATATFNGQSSAAVAFSSAGAATATFTTQSGAQSPMSAAGAATATFTTQSSVATPFSTAGVATATFSTQARASADFTMSGTATAVFTATTGGTSSAEAVMAGSATANFAAASLAPSAFTVSGQATVLFRGQAVTPNQRPYLQWGKRPPAHETYDEEILALSHAMGSYLIDMVEGRYVSKAKIKLGKRTH